MGWDEWDSAVEACPWGLALLSSALDGLGWIGTDRSLPSYGFFGGFLFIARQTEGSLNHCLAGHATAVQPASPMSRTRSPLCPIGPYLLETRYFRPACCLVLTRQRSASSLYSTRSQQLHLIRDLQHIDPDRCSDHVTCRSSHPN
jgi:hypothetical protein